MQITRNYNYLVSGGSDGNINVFDTQTNEMVNRIEKAHNGKRMS